MMYYFVMTAIICLSLTILAGFILTWKILPLELLSTIGICYFHILHLESQVGWFSLLIFGFSYKLILMFSLSHEFSMKWVKRAFVTYVAGLLILIPSFWVNAPLVQKTGSLLLFCGFLFFTLDVKEENGAESTIR